MENKFTCVNCGAPIHELYKKYSSTVLKVTSCLECGCVADKYIEYDPVIIIIDLILLNKRAYRHILYNTKFENHWKFAVILLLMETYSEWINSPNFLYNAVMYNLTSSFDYQRETKFYFIYFQVILGAVIFVMTIYVLSRLNYKIHGGKRGEESMKIDKSFLTIWKTTTLSSFGRFLHLPALIWGDTKQDSMHFLFVLGYTMLTQLLVHSVSISCSRRRSTGIIFIAYLMKIYATNFVTISLITLYKNIMIDK